MAVEQGPARKEAALQIVLTPTQTQSVCPYKGAVSYYDLQLNGDTYKDVVWTYPDPIPESPRIKGLLAF